MTFQIETVKKPIDEKEMKHANHRSCVSFPRKLQLFVSISTAKVLGMSLIFVSAGQLLATVVPGGLRWLGLGVR